MGTSNRYDAIVVGARCAGPPTAMLLAQQGHHVLLVDKTTFPSDTISTHIVHPHGVAALERWSLAKPLKETGCPPFTHYALDFGPVTMEGSLRPVNGTGYALCPRRTVLDKLLVDAAVRAGAELREGFTVDEVVFEHGAAAGIRGHQKGGNAESYNAHVIVGADGRNSVVAKAVRAERYEERPVISVGYYAYWSGLPAESFKGYIRERAAFAFAPTHDGLTLGVISWPRADFDAIRRDIEGRYRNDLAQVPAVHERVQAAKRETRFVGTADLPNFFRKPYGPGWVLLGDAGHHKDPITAHGISDAFRDAEAVAKVLHDVLAGSREFDEGMAAYQKERDAQARPKYDLTCMIANLEEPPPPEMQQLIAAMAGNRQAMSDFLSTVTGIIPAPEFFAPENTARILAEAGRAPAG
jgi:flavin-dependent dehydrogenase